MGDDLTDMGISATAAAAMGREQVVLAHHPEHPLAGNTDATTDPKPSPDLAVSLALPGGCLQVGLDGHQQSLVRDRGMLHRARELLVRQRTMVINALRGHCAELGLIVAQGASKVEELVAIIEDPGDVRLPPLAREALGSLVEQLRSAQARIKQLEVTLLA